MIFARKLFNCLGKDKAILRQLQWYLLLLQVYTPTKRHFTRLFEPMVNNQPLGWSFPNFPTAFKYYYVISNGLLCWILLKNLLPAAFAGLARVIHGLIGSSSGRPALGSHCYLFGRTIFIQYKPNNDLVGFMFASFHFSWRLMQWCTQRAYLLNVVLFQMQPKANIGRFIEKLQATPDDGHTNLALNEPLLADILCYKLIQHGHNNARISLKLRPNRTLEARERLDRRLVQVTAKTSAAFCLLGAIINYNLATFILTNQEDYMNSYSGCMLEQSTSGSHLLITQVFDIIENYFIWPETGLVAFFGLAFVCFLNEDLRNYWMELDESIKSQLDERRLGEHYNDEHIYELQAKLADFFHQIKQVDVFISDVITEALLSWLCFFGVLTVLWADLYLIKQSVAFGFLGIGFCSLIFAYYSASSISLLTLQRACKLSYVHLCSLMAHDQSRYKRHFTRIIDFYTTNNCTCYTLFQHYPYSSRNFASIFGWSLSAFLVLDGIYHRSRAVQNLNQFSTSTRAQLDSIIHD